MAMPITQDRAISMSCVRETADIMKIRYGVNCAGSFQIVNYHEEVKFGPYKVTLIPAGHILGSAQVLIETNKERILVTRL